MRRTPVRLSKRRRGMAAVEAALVLPVVLLFLVAAVDLGRLAKYADSVTNAARDGAQYGCANTTAANDSTGIRSAGIAEMTNLPNVTSTNPTFSQQIVTDSGTGTQFLQVTVSYNTSGTSYFHVWPVNTITRTVEMPMMPQ